MSPDLRLRDAVLGDEAQLLRFIRELAEYERLPHLVRATEERLRECVFGPRPYLEALIAERGGEPIGFATWHYPFRTFACRPTLYVEDIFVRPAQRGGGVGMAIFRDLARRAMARECDRMDWSVLHTNAPAIAFYRRIGAKSVDDWGVQRLSGDALAALAA
jgi:GNAT superfamily N-acetyltransferase